MRTRNVSGKEEEEKKKCVEGSLSQWLVTSDCFHLRLGNLRGNEDFTGDWISRRKKHGPEVQLLTLTIEKLLPLWGDDHILQHPQRGESTGAKGKGGKIKSQKTISV